MSLPLIFTIIIALLIIILIILYNGVKLSIIVTKENININYNLIISLLRIPIFKKNNLKIDDEELKDESEEELKEESEENENNEGLIEKYNYYKPILKEIYENKNYLISFTKKVLKEINFKKINGNLILGLSDNTKTIKIASWIWSIGAIVNPISKPICLTVEPNFIEEKIDFNIGLEAKINLLIFLIELIKLLTKKEIINIIKEFLELRENRKEEQ